ncbi:hypothetical protein [Microbacterium terregens]|jgi:hypothetical protein|uniref:Uncharacterized protein n=1 Tax=Microbacterium terregens TaxID=69363 RepID=A0ABV5SZ46_9MICO
MVDDADVQTDGSPHTERATPVSGSLSRFGYALGALPGVVLHLVGSAVAWTFIQLNGLMVAGCGTDRPCNFAVTDAAVNGIQPLLIAVWAITSVSAFARALARGRSPWPVLGIGVGVSILITGLAYLALVIGAGVL